MSLTGASLMQYPDVVDEWETLNLVMEGKSIARYGDGEFKLIEGKPCVSQKADPRLAEEMRGILFCGDKRLLVAIPRLDERNPKNRAWVDYAPRFARHLSPKKTYYSAFISRPDNAPWINQPHFFDSIEMLWRDEPVTLVANGKRSLTREMLLSFGAKDVAWVECSYRDSYDDIDRLENECLHFGRRVILCCGPTATCLAWRLHRSGLHAVDLGHIGMFWRRADIGEYGHQREINKETGEVEPNP